MTLQRTFLALTMMVAIVGSASADDVGVTGRKLVLLAKPLSAKFKVVYLSKGDLGVHKGASGDPAQITGAFEWFYTDEPSSLIGSFVMPSSHWIENSDAVAKFRNPDAFSGIPTSTKVTVVKPGLLAKFVATAIGDTGAGDFSSAAPPSESGGVTTVLSINNGNDSSTHRMCTKFAVDSGTTVIFKEIAGGTGRKLIAKNGVPTSCP